MKPLNHKTRQKAISTAVFFTMIPMLLVGVLTSVFYEQGTKEKVVINTDAENASEQLLALQQMHDEFGEKMKYRQQMELAYFEAEGKKTADAPTLLTDLREEENKIIKWMDSLPILENSILDLQAHSFKDEIELRSDFRNNKKELMETGNSALRSCREDKGKLEEKITELEGSLTAKESELLNLRQTLSNSSNSCASDLQIANNSIANLQTQLANANIDKSSIQDRHNELKQRIRSIQCGTSVKKQSCRSAMQTLKNSL